MFKQPRYKLRALAARSLEIDQGPSDSVENGAPVNNRRATIAIAANSAPPRSALLDPNQNARGARDPSRSVGAPNLYMIKGWGHVP
jgi:hypothetical protein